MVKAVLIRISTQEIIKTGNYPSTIIEPIPSLEDDLKWLIVFVEDQPNYDESTEILERQEEITETPHPDYPLMDQYRVYWNVIPMTAEQQQAYQDNLDDNDASSLSFNQYKFDGEVAFNRAFKLIQRRFDNGVITANQAKNVADALFDALLPLKSGLWQLSKVRVDAITPPANANLLAIYNAVKTRIDNYIIDNGVINKSI